MPADLHCHTKMSDGSVGIDELVQLAKRSGLSAIAVAAHDTFSGALRAKSYGDRIGMEVLPGAEFSCMDPATGRKAHVLCYGNVRVHRLEGLCKKIGDNRRRSVSVSLQKVMRLYPITMDMVVQRAHGSSNIFKQHIMHALIDAGYADSFYGAVYEKLFRPRTGFAYCKTEYPDVHDVIAQIHDAGGIAVLAHPGIYDSYDLLEQLARDHEIEGVEVWHTRNREGDAERFMQIATQYHLIMTGGTDFHGMYSKVTHPLGTCTTPDDQLTLLKKLRVE